MKIPLFIAMLLVSLAATSCKVLKGKDCDCPHWSHAKTHATPLHQPS